MFKRSVLVLVFLLVTPMQARAAAYIVQPGDTLSAIAHSHHTTVAALARANGLRNVNLVQVGRVLLIPAAPVVVTTRTFWYRVRWGDTLSGIAARYRLYYSTIHALNPRLGAYPLAGQWLKLCGPCGSAAPASEAAAAPSTTGSGGTMYVVQRGDSLSGIAAHFGVSVRALVGANSILNPNTILVGARLTVPTSGPGPVVSTYDPWDAKSLIVSYARLYGVNPAFALSIGWQESGFNQTLISRTGAIGVMQVEPYTGTTISRLLGRSMNLYLLRDNVQSGCFWLGQLLQYYGYDERLAAAAYYQGTKSIARHGLFTDTVQYAANVLALKSSFVD